MLGFTPEEIEEAQGRNKAQKDLLELEIRLTEIQDNPKSSPRTYRAALKDLLDLKKRLREKGWLRPE